MTGRRALLIVALLLLAASQLLATPANVNIRLQPGEPRTIETTPRAEAVCRNTENCPTEVNYRWTGSGGAEGETLKVKYLAGLYWVGDEPRAVAASECFAFPGGENPFALEHGPQNSRTVVFKQDSEGCPDKVFFFYEISCTDGEGKDCGGVQPLDPGMMVDNGRR